MNDFLALRLGKQLRRKIVHSIPPRQIEGVKISEYPDEAA
jgi:hypothetical protein